MKRKQSGLRLSFSAILTAAILFWGNGTVLFFVCAALLHELGHLAALRILHGRVEQLRFRLSGAEILYSDCRLSYRDEILVALAGPAVNLLCAVLGAGMAQRVPAPWLYQMIGCHLVLGLFNLIPAFPLDGGRVGRALLELAFPLYGESMADVLSAAVGAVLLIPGVLLLEKGGNLSLLSAACVILFHSVSKWSLHREKKELK